MLAINNALITLILLFSVIPFAWAQSVTPTRLQLKLDESPDAVLTLTSTKAVDVALELTISDYSALQLEQAPLEILPPQILLRPGETRQVKVSWRGGAELKRSKSYYLAIDELPLVTSGPESAAEIQLLTSWRLPLHVEVGGNPDVDLVTPPVDGSASFELHNSGRRYALLSQYEIGVQRDSKTVVFDGLELARLLNRDALLPGQTVSIPLRMMGVEAAGLQGAQLLRKE